MAIAFFDGIVRLLTEVIEPYHGRILDPACGFAEHQKNPAAELSGALPRSHFALLREIGKRNELPLLSMGMSADFLTAIEFGTTHVRIGSAIFGARG